MESAGIEFHNRVREGYLKIAKEEPERIKVVNSIQTVNDVFEEVKKIVNKYLSN